jgi:hypothetical protein
MSVALSSFALSLVVRWGIDAYPFGRFQAANNLVLKTTFINSTKTIKVTLLNIYHSKSTPDSGPNTTC